MSHYLRLSQLDRITELELGKRITGVKCLSLSENYLRDHFPRFPVMPGVLMLEALTQACCWLVRASEDFEHSMVVLKEARNVKYTGFVEPGQTLVISATLQKQDEETATLKAEGFVNDAQAVSGRLILEKFDLADRLTGHEAIDVYTRRTLRTWFDQLYQPSS